MILGKYKSKKKLGKGAYGEVLLVQDNASKLFALKLIAMKALLKQSYLMDYLQGEIDCMKNLNSPYIMKLYQTQEDENFKYLVCEYCDGGDLLNLQAKQAGKVFTLEKATQILSEVIKGLYHLHESGYLHRDIKSQNILVKTENGKQTYKLADFGFSKKCNEIGGTVLGTENYMSPEIYRNETYGFEVDMWAFAVLFYFMLNMEFPFKINPHASLQKKQAELISAAVNFSYQKLVKQSKKKLVQNSTKQVEDLFRKMFQTNSEKRINFAQIREHPLFIKHFPQVDTASKILYGKKFQSKNFQKGKQTSNKAYQNDDNVMITHSIIKPKDKKFPKQRQTLQRKKDQIDFLKENALQFYQNNEYFKPGQRYSLSFNLLKYYIILLREFIDNLNPASLGNLYPKLSWNDFCKTNEFKDIKKQAEEDRLKNQLKFQQLYDQCSYSLNQIDAINSKFKAAFEREISDIQFDGAFKESYRKSTHTSFNTLRSLIKTSGKSGNKLNFNLAILVISHVFNHIFLDPVNTYKIFQGYFNDKSRTVQNIDYNQLREWMTRATGGQLNALAKEIILLYFA